MYRYFFRFVVASLTILTVNLLTNAIIDFMVSYKNQYKPFTFTLLGMVLIVVVFYPLFMKLEDWLKNIASRVAKSGNSLAGRYFGLALTFTGSILVLSYFYAKVWYHIDLVSLLFHGNIKAYL
jgi:hypothetical protein